MAFVARERFTPHFLLDRKKTHSTENYLWGNSNIYLVSLGNGHLPHFHNTLFYYWRGTTQRAKYEFG